jgi:hypothetical protein
VTAARRNPVLYLPGRATPGRPADGPAQDGPMTAGKTTYQVAAYLAYHWAPTFDERLTAIEAEAYDLADQVRALGHRVTVALLTTIAAIGVLVAYAVMAAR